MRPTHKLKVEGATGFVRDMSNGAILYTKQEEVNEARHRKAQRLAKENRIDKLENDVSEIKEMLKVLVEKNG
jgi:uncharacterized protein YdbL (DUF1318 family)|tara:strand:- start:2369 stop:2584 length:216 start_codon:yes stop_codon:yes gene_type:complete